MSALPASAHISGFVVGAYAASPTHSSWDPAVEAEFFTALASTAEIGALEIPWMGSIHPHDDEWMLQNFPADLTAVVTDIPFVMGQLGKHESFGLASGDADGRKRALEFAARMRDDVERMNSAQGRQVVAAVELHGAPRPPHVTPVALAASLSEIASWDWQGAQLVIEHQDAFRADLPPQKGFLTLGDEIDAIRASGAPVGISLNWGRSVIEGRQVQTATDHALIAAASSLLRGFIVSGASDADGETSPAWVDAHHAFRAGDDQPHGDAASLLTEESLRPAIAAAGDLDWIGVKVGWPASREGSVNDRTQLIRDAIAAVSRVQSSL